MPKIFTADPFLFSQTRDIPDNVMSHINKYKQEKDRMRSSVAYSLIDKAIDLRKHSLIFSDTGCPIIEDGSYFVSVSHSGDLVAVAVSSTSPVGVDVERIVSRRSLDSIARRSMDPSEYEIFISSEEEKKLSLFYKYWTIKEAYGKMTGKGLGGSPGSIIITGDMVGEPKVEYYSTEINDYMLSFVSGNGEHPDLKICSGII